MNCAAAKHNLNIHKIRKLADYYSQSYRYITLLPIHLLPISSDDGVDLRNMKRNIFLKAIYFPYGPIKLRIHKIPTFASGVQTLAIFYVLFHSGLEQQTQQR